MYVLLMSYYVLTVLLEYTDSNISFHYNYI